MASVLHIATTFTIALCLSMTLQQTMATDKPGINVFRHISRIREQRYKEICHVVCRCVHTIAHSTRNLSPRCCCLFILIPNYNWVKA